MEQKTFNDIMKDSLNFEEKQEIARVRRNLGIIEARYSNPTKICTNFLANQRRKLNQKETGER